MSYIPNTQGEDLFEDDHNLKKTILSILGLDFKISANANNPNALREDIEVVTVDNTANWWSRSPLGEIFAFRGRVVSKLGWKNHINFMNLPYTKEHSETDNSDMQGTVYFVKRFMSGEIACVVRVHPSIDKLGRDISMIGLNLPHLVGPDTNLPLSKDIYETSRVILDDARLPRKLADGRSNPDRKKAAIDCLASSVIYCHSNGIKGFFCFMPVRVWEAAYKSMGLKVERLGPDTPMQDTPDSKPYDVYAGYMEFTDDAIAAVKKITGFDESKLNYGITPEEMVARLMRHLSPSSSPQTPDHQPR